jgi:hypothetical protein
MAVLFEKAKLQAQALQQGARPAGMAGGPAADADGVIALRLQIEEREKGNDGIELRQRHVGFGSHVFQNFAGEILVGVMLLDALQDAQQSAGASGICRDCAVGEALFFERDGH